MNKKQDGRTRDGAVGDHPGVNHFRTTLLGSSTLSQRNNDHTSVITASDTDSEWVGGIDPNGVYTTREAALLIKKSIPFLEARRIKKLPPKARYMGRSVHYIGRDLIAVLLAGDDAKGGSNG